MQIVSDKLTLSDLKELACRFGNLVKAVVDIEKEIMAIDAELHGDEEVYLLENGSKQKNLWGINLYPELENEDFIEFDSMINLRPASGNSSRGVDDPKLREKITKIVHKLIQK
ncbi:MAG: hypothetical protein ACD_37C00207G0002 [uncultured bacterium]|nr:MAG: hypothetical protein ACD_37C00207G0002 [uncultured bacterium]